MIPGKQFDVIIVGGSYAGLAAAMSLGRALRKVLIIDDGKPCNRQTPYSHNFLTNDGRSPAEIASIARQQLSMYETVRFLDGSASNGITTGNGFEIQVTSGESFAAKKIIFATGIRDILPGINGLAACWGISVIHCPYCHGYEVRNKKTGFLGNGGQAYDSCRLISNWTKDLTLFTNGPSLLTAEQTETFGKHHIEIVEKEIDTLEHTDGQLECLVFKDGSKFLVTALYTDATFEQSCNIPASLGCELKDNGYIKVDEFQETTMEGVFACGDNATRTRTVANAVAMGTITGITVSKKIILDEF